MPAAAGFQVAPGSLDEAATALVGEAGQVSTVYGEVTGGQAAPGAFGALPASSTLATAYQSSVAGTGTALRGASQHLDHLVTGLRDSAANYLTGDERVAAGYRSLLGTGAPQGSASNAAGTAPFADLIAANRRRVSDALDAERTTLATLKARHADSDDITAAQHRIDLYESILDDNRQILDFDPAGKGRIVELVGTLDAHTTNVGVLVPGTFANLDNYSGLYDRAKSFVDADKSGGLAMITWQNGDFPPNLADAASAGYAETLSPQLADFSHQLRGAVDATGSQAQITVAGHSYGGAVVGLAEHDGLDADRVMHIESAGMGHDVWQPGDLHDTQPDVARYSMTAPGDPIRYVRGLEVGNLGHGANPDTFPGTVDLATGNYANGTEIKGVSAHSGVFTVGSDAWRNMYDVFTGQPVTPVAPAATPAPAPVVRP